MTRRTLFTLFAVFMVLLAGFSGLAAADHTESDNDANSTATDHDTDEEDDEDEQTDEHNDDETATDGQQDSPEYPLKELRQTGTHLTDAPTTSVRAVDGQLYWWVEWSADKVWSNPGEDDNWEYLDDGGHVDRNTVYFRTIRPDSPDETIELTLVYWTEETETRTVEKANGETETVTDRSANVHGTETKEIELNQEFVLAPVKLPQHDDEVQVTVFMNGEPQWRFTHQSVATTQSSGVDSQGSYWWNAMIDFLLPIILGLFLVGPAVKRAIDRAGIGPDWGYGAWIILLMIGTASSLLWFFSSVADLLINLPWVFALFILGLIAVIMLETYTVNVRKVLFYKPDIQTAVSPSGEEAVDQIDAQIEEHKLVDMGTKGRAVVKSGLRAFLSRVFGSGAYLEGDKDVKSRLKLTEGKWDEVIFVHPESEEVLEYTQEGWQWKLPTPENDGWSAVLSQYGGVLAGGYIATTAFGVLYGPALAVLLAGAVWLRPRDGYASVVPAPTHMRSAIANMMMLTQEFNDAEVIDELQGELWSERVRSEKDVEEVVEDFDETLVEEMLDSDVDRSRTRDLDRSVDPDQTDQERDDE